MASTTATTATASPASYLVAPSTSPSPSVLFEPLPLQLLLLPEEPLAPPHMLINARMEERAGTPDADGGRQGS